MNDGIALVRPALRLGADFQELSKEFLAEGDTRYEVAALNVPDFVQLCRDHAAGRNLPQGWVPQSTFWLVRGDDRILGCSRLRHQLTPFLSHEGGHVGYDIRPSERHKGYGTLLLRLTLIEARDLGLGEVLITADEANLGSWKVIERNGGRREEGNFAGPSGPFRRYWVSTAALKTMRVACPCCGFLTLRERGAFECCAVCYWEDDGQDDADADVVRGGPNHLLSLTKARVNFRIFGASDDWLVKFVRPPRPEERA